ncbi:MAG TPA: hypothetical protein VFY45_18495 [Baekduia sp.]|nr:hypothetical protein [Baekduia sp.]
MRHSAYDLLPDEAIEPTSTPPGTEHAEQLEILRELRGLQNAIPAAQLARDRRLAAIARTGTVSRRDMARACGLNKSRVDQIIATHA